jgi:UDPglucose 6-dehydrogenase
MQRIGIIGTNRVALTLGATLAKNNHYVFWLTSSEEHYDLLCEGVAPVSDPAISTGVHSLHTTDRMNLARDFDQFSQLSPDLVIFTEVSELNDLEQNFLSFLWTINNDCTILIYGNVPVGVCDELDRILQRRGPREANITIAHTPCLINDGMSVEKVRAIKSVIVGGDDLKRTEEAFGCKVLHTDRATSELAGLIYHAKNGLDSVLMSITALCASQTQSDAAQICEYIGLPKLGIGLSGTIVLDAIDNLITHIENQHGNPGLLQEALHINSQILIWTLQRLEIHLGGFKDKQIAILGLSNGDGTSSMSGARSIEIVEYLRAKKASVKVFDAYAMGEARATLSGVEFADNPEDCVTYAECIILGTDSPLYERLNWLEMKDAALRPILFDPFCVMERERMNALGFKYIRLTDDMPPKENQGYNGVRILK